MFTHLDDPNPPTAEPELVDRALGEGRHRLRRRRMARRAAAALVGIVALGGVAGAISLTRTTRDAGVYAGEGDGQQRHVTFEVLAAVEAGPEEVGSLRSAVTRAEYEALWQGVDGKGPAPAVDLDRNVVVSITIPDDACPPTLTGFDRDGDVLTPRFVETASACDEPLIPKTFVVALDREAVTPSFTLRLPGQPVYGFDEQVLAVAVSARPVRSDEPTTTTGGEERLSEESTVTADGVGPVRLGMTVEEAERAASVDLVEQEGYDEFVAEHDCAYVFPEGELRESLAFMVSSGRIVRIDILDGELRTTEDVGIGSTEAEVRASYEGVETTPHPYLDPPGHYLTVRHEGDDDRRFVFETDGATVLQYRTGLVPHVEYIEGCV